MEKRIDIAAQYASEIGKINDKLRDLRAGRFEGYNGNGSNAGFYFETLNRFINSDRLLIFSI